MTGSPEGIPPDGVPPERTRPGRIRLVVLFGGRSAEHDISCISASHVLAALDPERYDVIPVGITRDGEFVRAAHTAELSAAGRPTQLVEVLGTEDLSGRPEAPTGAGYPAQPDRTVVLPILHGPNGEDGTVQGLLEMIDVPYVGAGVLASAVCMDKAMAKTVLAAAGIPQVRWSAIGTHQEFGPDEAKDVLADLGPTVFVKPANMGSSIGVSRVQAGDGPTTLLAAVHDASRYDDIVLFEAGVTGRELECAVLGNDVPQGLRARRGGRGSRLLRLPRQVLRRHGDDRSSQPSWIPNCPSGLAHWRCRPSRRSVQRHGAGGHVPHRGGRAARQRGEHDPRVHPDLHVPEAVGGLRAAATAS